MPSIVLPRVDNSHKTVDSEELMLMLFPYFWPEDILNEDLLERCKEIQFPILIYSIRYHRRPLYIYLSCGFNVDQNKMALLFYYMELS